MNITLAHIRPDVAALIECTLALICIAAVIYIIANFAIEAREQFKAAREIDDQRQRLKPPRPLPNICATRLSATASLSTTGTQPLHSGCGFGSACFGSADCADTHCQNRGEA